MAEESSSADAVSERGAARRRRAQGRHHLPLQKSMEDIDPDVALWSDQFVFGEVWSSENLQWQEQALVAITALAALRNHAQLKNYIHGALQDGVSEAAIRDALRMLTVYAGFPVAIQALDVLTTAVAVENRAKSG